MRGQILGRRQARRLSQHFARVGVEAPPKRLQEMLLGAPAADEEWTDVKFALIVTQLNHEKRVAKFHRRCEHLGVGIQIDHHQPARDMP
ncbi:membrane protein [Mycobacterium tuberculosis]|nr:membrane protein [Mycobacterium tuberculosis]